MEDMTMRSKEPDGISIGLFAMLANPQKPPRITLMLQLFNTLTKSKEEFKSKEEGKVSVYTCGPTVYGRPHIGNYSSFLMADLLCRWLEVRGYKVSHAKNITDVGHLTADDIADAGGEDKVEKEARKNKSGEITKDDVLAIARKYEAEFLEDEKALNMREPEFRPRATETIKEMVNMIGDLVENGFAYETNDGVYFSVERFSDYGKLSGNTLTNLDKRQEGVRVELSEHKKHSADFALWKKKVGENANHVLCWDSPWGEGFPGWHIECSAMSLKCLNPTRGESFLIDIHTGGEDNIFPHHECEIAQTEAATGSKFVGYWLHKRRVNFGDEKMSKSLGNVLSLSDIEAEGFSPLDLRYFFLSSHYRSHTQFTWKGMEDAKKARSKIAAWIEGMDSLASASEIPGFEDKLSGLIKDFEDAIDDDLNTPKAIASVFEVITLCKSGVPDSVTGDIKKFAETLDKTFACFEPEKEIEIPEEIKKLVEEREDVRASGDYAKSDEIRDELKKRGYMVEDLPEGPRIRGLGEVS